MGAWAEDAFGNDTACDWAGDFSDTPKVELVERIIESVIKTKDYLDSDEACECLVACEIIARLKGMWGKRNAYSESIDKWVESTDINVSEELTNKAKKAIARILGEDSELQELWDEGGKDEKWHSEMSDLLTRVSS